MEEQPPSGMASSDTNDLNARINEQGNVVRELKGEKAPVRAPSGGSEIADELNEKIYEQGNIVRKLRCEKAPKDALDAEIRKLLAYKAEYKKVTGKDWKPGQAPAKAAPAPATARAPAGGSGNGDELNEKIYEQGSIVRKLQTEKAPRAAVCEAVKQLLDLKALYLSATGKHWKPGEHVPSHDLNLKIIDQGNVVQKLKSDKAPKKQQSKKGKAAEKSAMEEQPQSGMPSGDTNDLNARINEQGSVVRELKGEKAPVRAPSGGSGNADELNEKIYEQGNNVRKLRTEKAPKDAVGDAVKALLDLEALYESATGKKWKPGQHVPSHDLAPAGLGPAPAGLGH